VRRKLSILWGVQTLPSTETGDFEAAIDEAVDLIRSQNIAAKGAAIVTVAGMPFGIVGTTNSLRVITL
ncbi:MAG: pyruvate kinase alpha/beta domain-containing protein, partial [Alphaproteobacteria bacterium]|nr:pyruvate kinase alpha/beta domain-containing protein [Alphaproteobacteria bacterium]